MQTTELGEDALHAYLVHNYRSFTASLVVVAVIRCGIYVGLAFLIYMVDRRTGVIFLAVAEAAILAEVFAAYFKIRVARRQLNESARLIRDAEEE